MTSYLQGGRRKRRAGTRLLTLVLLLVPLGLVGLAGWLALRDEEEPASRTQRATAELPPLAVEGEPAAASPRSPSTTAGAGVDAFRLEFKRPPRAGLVFDLRSGEILWRHQPVRRLPVASLTKVMTALLVVENAGARDEARVSKAALNYSGSGVGLLPKGRHVPVETLLHGLLLPSGNDAANVLAEHVGGTRAGFVAMMNARAKALGLQCTQFRSPSGISDGDLSCAADLAALSRLAMAQFRIARIARKIHAAVKFPRTKHTKRGRLFLTTTNPLLRMGYRGAIGLKTGYTSRAGRCLIAVVRRGSRTLGAVLLGSPDPARQARSLFAKAFRVPA